MSSAPSNSKNIKAQARDTQKAIRAICHQRHAITAAETAARHAMKVIKGPGASTVAGAQGDPASAPVVGLYAPTRTELDCRFLAVSLERAGIQTALPVVGAADQPLLFRAWAPGDPLIKGAFGIEEPEPDAPLLVPDTLIVPLLGFDEDCYRLGYGGGFYDRTLMKWTHMKCFGFAFAAQFMDKIPREAHDMPLMGVITEEGLVLPKKLAS